MFCHQDLHVVSQAPEMSGTAAVDVIPGQWPVGVFNSSSRRGISTQDRRSFAADLQRYAPSFCLVRMKNTAPPRNLSPSDLMLKITAANRSITGHHERRCEARIGAQQ